MSSALEREIDKVLGVVDSGKMDWVTLVESGREASEYSTPESAIDLIPSMSEKYKVRNYLIYWIFKNKILKLRASGRSKSDYSAVLEESAIKASQKNFSEDEKVLAIIAFSKDIQNKSINKVEAEMLLSQL